MKLRWPSRVTRRHLALSKSSVTIISFGDPSEDNQAPSVKKLHDRPRFTEWAGTLPSPSRLPEPRHKLISPSKGFLMCACGTGLASFHSWRRSCATHQLEVPFHQERPDRGEAPQLQFRLAVMDQWLKGTNEKSPYIPR